MTICCLRRGADVLVAYAFLCLASASDCEREAIIKAVVGQGVTPIACLVDGQAGAANMALAAGDGERVVIACRRGR